MFGRFLTPDWSAAPATVPYAHLDNPQTLNLYGYVGNNPINGIDPDGHAAKEYMVAGPAWGTNFYSPLSGDAELTVTMVTVLINSETNSAAVIGVQTSAITEEAAEALGSVGAGGGAQTPEVWTGSVSVLGQELKLEIGGWNKGDVEAATAQIGSAVADINGHAGQLTESQKNAIKQIQSLSVVAGAASDGVDAKGNWVLTQSYLSRSSTGWLASLFVHEGTHVLNRGKYTGEQAWKDEQIAGRAQLAAGKALGLSASEQRFIREWTADSNQVALQRHMEQGITF